MVRPFRKGHAGAGMSPGTLVSRKTTGTGPGSIRAYSYNAEQCSEIRNLKTPDLKRLSEDTGSIHWIITDAAHDARTVQEIGECFGLNPLIMEDVMNPGHPVKMEDWDDFAYFVLKTLNASPSGQDVTIAQVSLIVSKRFVILFYDSDDRFLKPVIARLVGGKGRMRRSGTEYLAYAVIDSIVDHYYAVIEMFSDQIDRLEPAIIRNPSNDLINRIFKLKREMLVIRNSIRPLADILDDIIHPDSEIFPAEIDPYFRDVSDHVTHVIETLEIFREILTQMIESAMTSLSNRLNEVMKTLTIIATIFIPLTFIAGVYGMNFDFMPELRWKWGYPTVLATMAAVIAGMVGWFRHRKWF